MGKKKSAWDSFKSAAGAPVNAVKTAFSGGSASDVLKAGGQASLGGQVIGSVAGTNSVLGKAAQGDFGGAVEASKSHKAEKAAALAKQMQDKEDEQFGKNTDYNKQLGDTDDSYLSTMGGNVKKYQGDLDGLKGEIEASQKDAGATYSNQVQPRLKDLMESAQKNSASAMSLQDAMDPNNAVATKTRALYAKQGQDQNDAYRKQGAGIQSQYETQAQNEGKSGLADVGVLGALGMQNMAGQLGNIPMTGGQLQALMGANQSQAGAAYAKTLQRTQGLRDQGLQGNIALQNQGLGRQSDLGTAGLQAGSQASNTAYGQGQQAQQTYGQSVGNYEGAADRQQARDADFRGQRGDISNKTYGLQQQMADSTRGVAQGKTQRDMANYNTHMGGQQANLGGQIQTINGQQAADASMKTGALSAAGTAAGAYFGGPAGAAAGGEAGKQVGQANAPAANAVPQTGNYNYGGNGAQMGPPAYAAQGSNMPMPPDEGGGNGLSLTGGAGQGARGMPARGGQAAGGFQANPYAYQNQRNMTQARQGGRGGNSRGARA